MKYIITFRQYCGQKEPLLIANTAPSTEKLKFFLDVMEQCNDTFELLSIVPVKED